MSAIWRRVIAVLFALTIAGCDQQSAQYLKQGIGTDLYTSQLPEATRVQQLYIGLICEQAGLPVIQVAPDTVQCASTIMTPTQWELFVFAGINDIDRRCNSYLQWLYQVKKGSEFVIKELSDVSALTQGALKATDVGSTAITLVGLGFNLAQNTFTNIKSSLILEVNHSTVQTIVVTKRNDFQRRLKETRVQHLPAAVNVLQNYLQICVPYTIETEINVTVTGVQLDGPIAANRPPLNQPILAGRPLAPREPVPTQPFVRPHGTPGDYEDLIKDGDYSPDKDTVENFVPKMKKICATSEQMKSVDANLSPLRYLISVYQLEDHWRTGINVATDKLMAVKRFVTGRLTREEIGRLSTIAGTCDAIKFSNYFEFARLKSGVNSPQNISRLNNALKKLPGDQTLKPGATVADVRAGIALARGVPDVNTQLLFIEPRANTQMTSDLFEALVALSD